MEMTEGMLMEPVQHLVYTSAAWVSIEGSPFFIDQTASTIYLPNPFPDILHWLVRVVCKLYPHKYYLLVDITTIYAGVIVLSQFVKWVTGILVYNPATL